MHLQRKVVAIAAALGMFATFLPWANVPIVGSVSGTAGDGWITFVLFLITLVVAMRGDKVTLLKGKNIYGAVIPAGLAALIGIWKIADFNAAMNNLGDDPFSVAISSSVSIGMGLYVLIAAGVVASAAPFLLKDKSGPAKHKTVEDAKE